MGAVRVVPGSIFSVLSIFSVFLPRVGRATEAKQIASTSSKIPTYHRTLATAGRPMQEKNVEELIISIQRSTIPFLRERCDLFDLATKIVMPKEVKRDTC